MAKIIQPFFHLHFGSPKKNRSTSSAASSTFPNVVKPGEDDDSDLDEAEVGGALEMSGYGDSDVGDIAGDMG